MSNMWRTRRFGCLAAVVFTLLPALAVAQTTGSISGTVIDQSKAVMPGVTLTVTNLNTSLQRVHVTDTQGR